MGERRELRGELEGEKRDGRLHGRARCSETGGVLVERAAARRRRMKHSAEERREEQRRSTSGSG